MLIAARACSAASPLVEARRCPGGDRAPPRRRPSGVGRAQSLVRAALALAFVRRADGIAACWRWPTGRSAPPPIRPRLTELRPGWAHGSTLVLAPEQLLADEHGRDYLVWELRGGRVCVEVAGPRSTGPPPPGISRVIAQSRSTTAPFAGLQLERRAGPYTLWRLRPPPRGRGPCPLISVGKRADLAENAAIGDSKRSSGPHAGSVRAQRRAVPQSGMAVTTGRDKSTAA